MDDKTLERELEALFAVDPSPAFKARVRERIATQPAERVTWLPWAFAAGSLVAAAILAFVVLRAPSRPVPAPELASRHVDVAAEGAPAISPHPGARGTPARRAGAGAARLVRTLPHADVIIDAREARAWRRVLGGVGAGRVDLSRMARTEEPKPLPVEEDFVLRPILIEPLTPALQEQGVHP